MDKKDEKPIISFLLNLFTRPIRKQIYTIQNNFPKKEIDETNLNEKIFHYFKSLKFYDPDITETINKCREIVKIDIENFIPMFLNYFSYLPLDMEVLEYEYPCFFDESMKKLSTASFPFRLSSFYISIIIIIDFYYSLIVEEDILKPEELIIVFKSLDSFIFQNNLEKNAYKMISIFLTKLVRIYNYASKVVPTVAIPDAFIKIRNINNQERDYQIFILDLFSSLRYLPTLFESVNSYFQPLINLMSGSKSTSLHKAGNKFLRNFLGYILPIEKSQEISSFLKEICKMYSKISTEQNSYNSTLALFCTLSHDNKVFSIHKFLSSQQKIISSNQNRMGDVLKTFITILNGRNYAPPSQFKLTGENFTWRPINIDKNQLNQMMEIVISNKMSFSQYQKQLSNFFSQIVSSNFSWFMQNQINLIIEEEFLEHNLEAILKFSISILKKNSPLMHFSDVSKNDPIVTQFIEQVRGICIQIFEKKSVQLFNTNGKGPLVFNTNSFTEMVKLGSEQNEMDYLLEHTVVIPLIETEQYPINEIFQNWNAQTQHTVNFKQYIDSFNEDKLKTFKSIPKVDNILLYSLCLYFYTEQPTQNQIFNKIPLFLFSNFPIVSALTIHLLQAYVHLTKNTASLESLLTIQVQKYEELYNFGLCLLRVVESLNFYKIKLSSELSESVFAWQCILIAAPYSNIREIGFSLIKSATPDTILQDNAPNFFKFLKDKEDEITECSSKKFIALFSFDDIQILHKFTLENVAMASSSLLYHAFLTTTFYMFNSEIIKCPLGYQRILHAQLLTLINSKHNKDMLLQNWLDDSFIINLMSLRLATTSSFDKITTLHHITSMLDQAKEILKNTDSKQYLSFFSSINPSLGLIPSKLTDEMSILILCFTVRFYKNDFDLISIESHFHKVITYFYENKIIEDHLFKINKEKLKENSILEISLCNMLNVLEYIFHNNSELYAKNDISFFLRTTYCLPNSENNISKLFDPEVWFPFLFSLALVPHSKFSKLSSSIYNVLSMFCMLVKLPNKYISSLSMEIHSPISSKLYTDFLLNSPSLITSFIQKSIKNSLYFSSICQCFQKPNGIKSDLNEMQKNISNIFRNYLDKNNTKNSYYYIYSHEFDSAIFENIGYLLALGSYYLWSNEAKLRKFSFRLIYHLSLIASITKLTKKSSLLSTIENLKKNYFNDLFFVNTSQIRNLQKSLSIVFNRFGEQFIYHSINIINEDPFCNGFKESIYPWFENIQINTFSNQILPNCFVSYFTPYTLIKKVIDVFKNELESNDTKYRNQTPCYNLILTDKIIGSNPLYIIDFIIFEQINYIPILIFISMNYHEIAIPYIISFLKHDYYFYCVLKNNNSGQYTFSIQIVLSTIEALLLSNFSEIIPFMHIIFLFCTIHPLIEKSNKIVSLIKKIYCDFQNEERNLTLNNVFNENQLKEIADEAYLWMVSFNDIVYSINAIEFYDLYFKERQFSENQIEVFKATIKTLYKLLYQSTQEINSQIDIYKKSCSRLDLNYKFYLDYISSLTVLINKQNADPHFLEIIIELLSCNTSFFDPIFINLLKIILNDISSFSNYFEIIFYKIISAELNQLKLDYILQILLKIAVFPNNLFPKIAIFFTLIPFLYICQNTGNNKNDRYHDILIRFIELFENNSLNENNMFSDDSLNTTINNLSLKISGEIQYLILNFFMNVLEVTDRKYFSIIYKISLIYLKKNTKEMIVTPVVFNPLAEYIIKNNNIKLMREFLLLYSPISSNQSLDLKLKRDLKSMFPKLQFQTVNSEYIDEHPFLITEEWIEECKTTHKLKRIISTKNIKQFEEQKSNFINSTLQEIPSNTFPFKLYMLNSTDIETHIENLLTMIDKKPSNLRKGDILNIQRVDCSIFQVKSSDIDSFLD